MKADNEMQQILASYEDELTCPMYVDHIFVGGNLFKAKS